MIGALVEDEDQAKQINLLFIVLAVSFNGTLSNLPNSLGFVKFMSKISPSRYNCEGIYRRLVVGSVPDLKK